MLGNTQLDRTQMSLFQLFSTHTQYAINSLPFNHATSTLVKFAYKLINIVRLTCDMCACPPKKGGHCKNKYRKFESPQINFIIHICICM